MAEPCTATFNTQKWNAVNLFAIVMLVMDTMIMSPLSSHWCSGFTKCHRSRGVKRRYRPKNEKFSSPTSCQLHSRDLSINSDRPKFPWFDPFLSGVTLPSASPSSLPCSPLPFFPPHGGIRHSGGSSSGRRGGHVGGGDSRQIGEQ